MISEGPVNGSHVIEYNTIKMKVCGRKEMFTSWLTRVQKGDWPC